MDIDLKTLFLPLGGFKGADILSEKYRISNYGDIYDILNYRFIKLSLCGEPRYYYVTLSHKGVKGTYRVNRLVALSFIPNPKNLPVCHHKDRDKLNNFVGNLEWVTRSHNAFESDRSDNKGKNSNTKWKNVKYKGVTEATKGKYSIKFQGEYYGYCYDDKTAAQIFDVIASHYLEDPYLNFPNHKPLCKIKDIGRYICRRKEFKRHICKGLVDRIRYKYRHEYISKITLADQYNIPSTKISEILNGVPKKEKKPKFKFCDVGKIYSKRLVREKYLNGEYSRRRLAEIAGVSITTIDSWLKDLPNQCRRKSLPGYLQEEIACVYSTGVRQCDLIRLYSYINLTKSMVRNIKKKYFG